MSKIVNDFASSNYIDWYAKPSKYTLSYTINVIQEHIDEKSDSINQTKTTQNTIITRIFNKDSNSIANLTTI